MNCALTVAAARYLRRAASAAVRALATPSAAAPPAAPATSPLACPEGAGPVSSAAVGRAAITFERAIRNFAAATRRYGQSIKRFHASRRYTSRKKHLARADRERFPGIVSISEATYDFALTDAFTNAANKATQDADAHRTSRAAAPNAT